MKCKIENCNKDVMYKVKGICQMHYFRFMRNGNYKLKSKEDKLPTKDRPKKYRVSNPDGYQKINEPLHPLVDSSGYVYEHRYVYYEEVDHNPKSCEMCGIAVDWYRCHIDHIDTDVTNNDKYNLRCLCRACNTFRGHTSISMGKIIITIDGKSLTSAGWARQDGVKVSGATIMRRVRAGYSDYEAVYMKRKTHHSTKTKVAKTKYDEIRGIK